MWQYILTPPTLVNNTPFYAKSTGHVTRPCRVRGCLLTCLPYFLLFALWCNLMPKILSVAHSYSSLKCSDVGTMPTDHSNCWPMANQKYLKKICSLWTYLSYFFSGYKTWTAYFNFKFDWNFFRFQASAVLVNQVNMFLNWTNTVLFIYFLTFYESLPAHVEKRFYTATGAYFWVWSRYASNERSSFQTTLRTYINLTSPLTEKPHLHMTASPNFSLSKHLLTFHYQPAVSQWLQEIQFWILPYCSNFVLQARIKYVVMLLRQGFFCI